MKGIWVFLRSVGFKNVRPAMYGWFFNFLFTIFIYYSYYKAFTVPAGYTHLNNGEGVRISTFTFLGDIFQHYKGDFPLVFSLAFVFTFAFFIVSIYVSGGIYAVLVEEEKTSFTNLIASSTQNFSSMLKIALVNLLNLLAALIIPGILAAIFFNGSFVQANEGMVGVLIWIWLIITAVFVTYAVAVYDYSRIFRLRDDKNVFYSLRQAVVFVLSNKLNLFMIFLLYGVCLVLLYLFYIILSGLVNDLLYAGFLFLVYQLFIIVRYYFKIMVIRAEIRLLGND